MLESVVEEKISSGIRKKDFQSSQLSSSPSPQDYTCSKSCVELRGSLSGSTSQSDLKLGIQHSQDSYGHQDDGRSMRFRRLRSKHTIEETNDCV